MASVATVPAPTVTPEPPKAEDEVAQRRLIVEGMFNAGQDGITGGIVVLVYALALGANTFQIGLISSANMLGSAMQLGADSLLRRFQTRRRVGVIGMSTLAVGRVLMGLLPLAAMWIAAEYLAWGLLAGLILVSGAAQVVEVMRLSWISGVVAENERGKFLGERQLIVQLLGSVIAIMAASLIDWQRTVSPERGLVTAQVYYVIAAVLCLGSIFTLLTVPEPAVMFNGRTTGLRTLAEPFRDRRFRPVMNYYLIWQFSVAFAGPFFQLYLIQVVKLPLGAIALYQFIGQLVSLYCVRLWGRMADRFGSLPVLRLSVFGKMLFPLSWFLLWPTPAGQSPMLLYALVGVVHLLNSFNHGVGLTTINLALRMMPEGESTAYLATFRTFGNWIHAISPALGGAASTVLQDRGWSLQWTIYLLCMLSGMGRFSALVSLRWVDEPGARSLRHMARAMVRVPGFTFRKGLGPWLRFWGGPVYAGFLLVRLRLGRFINAWRGVWTTETD